MQKKNLFLFIPEREYLKPKVKGMVSRVENKINHNYFFNLRSSSVAIPREVKL